jgi:preprotein translocase subunit SecE
MALSGSLLMVAGMVALATIMVWVFATSFGP